jgi:hypothetical protein
VYEGWRVDRWETPVGDVDRLLMVSLVDATRELTAIFEASWMPSRPRWRVRFRDYPAYRNIDEAYRNELWRHIRESGQECGRTFTVQESPSLQSWGTESLHEVRPGIRHFVIATMDDILEVLSASEPVWEEAPCAHDGDPMPGKAGHLFVREDQAQIERLMSDLRSRNKPRGAG